MLRELIQNVIEVKGSAHFGGKKIPERGKAKMERWSAEKDLG
jgi:hypothetical protein